MGHRIYLIGFTEPASREIVVNVCRQIPGAWVSFAARDDALDGCDVSLAHLIIVYGGNEETLKRRLERLRRASTRVHDRTVALMPVGPGVDFSQSLLDVCGLRIAHHERMPSDFHLGEFVKRMLQALLAYGIIVDNLLDSADN